MRVKLIGSSRCRRYTEGNYSRYKGGWFMLVPPLVGAESGISELKQPMKGKFDRLTTLSILVQFHQPWNLENDLPKLHEWRGFPVVHLLKFSRCFFSMRLGQASYWTPLLRHRCDETKKGTTRRLQRDW